MLLAVSQPTKRANLSTLENALSCQDANEECLILIREAMLLLRMDEAGQEVQNELAQLRRQKAELERRVGSNKSRFQLLLKGAEDQLAQTNLEISRLDARIGSQKDSLKEFAIDKNRIEIERKEAIKEVAEAERKLALAHDRLKKVNMNMDQVKALEEDVLQKLKNAEDQSRFEIQKGDQIKAKAEMLEHQLAMAISQESSRVASTPPRTSSVASDPLECPVCNDKRVERVFQCGHPVCKTCAEVIKRQGKCHLCRAIIRTVTPLFVGEDN
jgi:hypothetical protein